MSFTIKDLQKLASSEKYKEFSKNHHILLNLGEKIYSRRKDLGLTQAELGKKSGIPQNKISLLESGNYGEPGREIIEKLSTALQIEIDYFNDSISRKTVELYNYILSKSKKSLGIMQFMKIPYFVDLGFIENKREQLTNFSYIRWNYGPFDKKVYDYQKLFSFENELGIKDIKFIYLSIEDQKLTENILQNIPILNGEKLKKLSYETYPMKNLGVSYGDNKHMGELLILK
ncbi:hypothetical protein DLH72_04320 [Candidatus Gracilibacteria bacterium]|nr:MAG: hypothetical protein DLH72_04320 [Candidatus Gracilibacteria bacterium]